MGRFEKVIQTMPMIGREISTVRWRVIIRAQDRWVETHDDGNVSEMIRLREEGSVDVGLKKKEYGVGRR